MTCIVIEPEQSIDSGNCDGQSTSTLEDSLVATPNIAVTSTTETLDAAVVSFLGSFSEWIRRGREILNRPSELTSKEKATDDNQIIEFYVLPYSLKRVVSDQKKWLGLAKEYRDSKFTDHQSGSLSKQIEKTLISQKGKIYAKAHSTLKSIVKYIEAKEMINQAFEFYVNACEKRDGAPTIHTDEIRKCLEEYHKTTKSFSNAFKAEQYINLDELVAHVKSFENYAQKLGLHIGNFGRPEYLSGDLMQCHSDTRAEFYKYFDAFLSEEFMVLTFGCGNLDGRFYMEMHSQFQLKGLEHYFEGGSNIQLGEKAFSPVYILIKGPVVKEIGHYIQESLAASFKSIGDCQVISSNRFEKQK